MERAVTTTQPRYPLGRLVQHDSRSLAFPVGALPRSAIRSVHWKRQIPILDQGEIGSCTGNAATGLLGTEPYASALEVLGGPSLAELDERYALGLYSDATVADEFPGAYTAPTWEDTGSSGLAVAKVLKQRGLCTSYRHAFGLQSVLSALQSGPVLIGIPWYEAMFYPDPDGTVTIDGFEAGGHEMVVYRLDYERQTVMVANSWGPEWGYYGNLRLRVGQLDYLLSKDGDCTVPSRPGA